MPLRLGRKSAGDLFGTELGAGHGTPMIDFGPQPHHQQSPASPIEPIGLLSDGQEQGLTIAIHHELLLSANSNR